MRRALALTAVLGLCLAGGPAVGAAQAQSTSSPDPGRWLPRLEDNLLVFRDGEGRDGSGPITRPQADVMLEQLAGVEAVFRRVPALRPPRGVEVRPHRVLAASRGGADAGTFVARTLLMQLFEPTLDIAVESTAAIEVHVNALDALLPPPRRPIASDADGPMYLEPPRLGAVAGHAVMGEGNRTAVALRAHEGRPLWLPVSQERFIRARIRDLEARRDTMRGELGQGPDARRPRGADLDDARQAIAQMRSLDPEAAKAMEKELERMTARLEGASLPGDGEVAASFGLMDEQIGLLEKELASLTPDERRAQAFLAPGSDRPSGLGPREGGTRGVVALNGGYFDRSVPPEEPQLVVVVFRFMGTPPTPESRILDRVRDELDWPALAELVR